MLAASPLRRECNLLVNRCSILRVPLTPRKNLFKILIQRRTAPYHKIARNHSSSLEAPYSRVKPSRYWRKCLWASCWRCKIKYRQLWIRWPRLPSRPQIWFTQSDSKILSIQKKPSIVNLQRLKWNRLIWLALSSDLSTIFQAPKLKLNSWENWQTALKRRHVGVAKVPPL